MSYVKIWVHAVWATKRHNDFLNKSVREKIFLHMKENSRIKGIEINFINGVTDHVHCLIRLKGDQTICNVIQSIKGESSHWINQNKMTGKKFEWAHEYFAASISESAIGRVREYIRNQERHHAKRTFAEEYEDFLERHGLKPMEGGEGDASQTPG
jgi:putative transposase